MKRIYFCVAATALLFTACLVRDTMHTLYLDPSGAVTWTVLEQDVHSDEQNGHKRRAEEESYLAAALAGEHDAALAFDRLGALHVDSRVLRERRPFAVRTEGHFPAIDRLAEAFFEGLGVRGRVELSDDGAIRRLTITLEKGDGYEGDEALMALVEEAGRYRIVLTEGRFVDARGFRLEGSGRSAVPQEASEEQSEHDADRIVLSLAWELD